MMNHRMNRSTRRRILLGGAGVASVAAVSTVRSVQATQPIDAASDRLAIIETTNQIAILSDRRDWAAVQDCFTEQVEFDYTSLLGGEPATIAAAAQVQQWASFFEQTFKVTQHLIGSHVVQLSGDTATCMAHFQAHHTYLDANPTPWLLAGSYDYELVRAADRWKVQKMKMTALWETGDRPF